MCVSLTARLPRLNGCGGGHDDDLNCCLDNGLMMALMGTLMLALMVASMLALLSAGMFVSMAFDGLGVGLEGFDGLDVGFDSGFCLVGLDGNHVGGFNGARLFFKIKSFKGTGKPNWKTDFCPPS